MEYTTLNSGIKMPMAGIGTFLLTPDQAESAVLEALKDGYRLIDTANAYVNEKAVGRAMKKSGLEREDIFLETKIWPSFYEQEDAVEKTDTSKKELMLVNKFHYLTKDYTPDNIVEVKNTYAYGSNEIIEEVYNAFKNMWTAAKK